MTVPKCKSCEFHERAYSVEHKRSPHYCKNPKAPNIHGYNQRIIFSQFMGTSPSWCPGRAKAKEVTT